MSLDSGVNSSITGNANPADPDCPEDEVVARKGIVQGKVIRLEDAVITLQVALGLEEDGMLGPQTSAMIERQWGDVTDPNVLGQLPEDVQAAIGSITDKIGRGMFQQHEPLQEKECTIEQGGLAGFDLPDSALEGQVITPDDGQMHTHHTQKEVDPHANNPAYDEGITGGATHHDGVAEHEQSTDDYVATLEARVEAALAADEAMRVEQGLSKPDVAEDAAIDRSGMTSAEVAEMNEKTMAQLRTDGVLTDAPEGTGTLLHEVPEEGVDLSEATFAGPHIVPDGPTDFDATTQQSPHILPDHLSNAFTGGDAKISGDTEYGLLVSQEFGLGNIVQALAQMVGMDNQAPAVDQQYSNSFTVTV